MRNLRLKALDKVSQPHDQTLGNIENPGLEVRRPILALLCSDCFKLLVGLLLREHLQRNNPTVLHL